MRAALAGPAAAIVLSTLDGVVDDDLPALVGPDAFAALRAALALRARRWAAQAGPDRAFEANSTWAASAALHDHTGPVLLVAADVPGLDGRLAEQALADLREGAGAVVAPSTDGSPFLFGLPTLDLDLLDLMVGADTLDAGFGAIVAAAADRGDGLGMLRSERRLVSAADARALAADPHASEELLVHLRGALAVRRAPPGGGRP